MLGRLNGCGPPTARAGAGLRHCYERRWLLWLRVVSAVLRVQQGSLEHFARGGSTMPSRIRPQMTLVREVFTCAGLRGTT